MAASARPSIFLRRPILSSVISIIITLMGAIAAQVLPIAQYPELIPPTVTVQMFYPGASAETIADTCLAPVEVQTNGVEHMLYMTSTASSGAGSGQIQIYFQLGSNADMDLVNVCNKVNLAQTQLPSTVRSLGVSAVKQSPAFLQFFSVYSPDDRYSDVYMFNWAQVNLIDELKRIEGVGQAQLFGYMDYSMRIWVHPDKLAKYGLTIGDVAAAIQEQNSQFAPGRLGDMPSSQDTLLTWQIDAKGRLPDVEDFENIIIRTGTDSSKLLLKDVARIELGGKESNVVSNFNGHVCCSGGVWLLPGANAIATGERVKARVEEIKKTLPDGMEIKISVDTNDFVRASINEVYHTLAEAMILVFLVVFIFLQNWRATLIPCIAVPVSIIGTFAGMFALGYTINTLTLFGLVLAIGIVVDDAIVVLENVERIMAEEHLPPKEATAKAMSEVTSALIAIVLVLCSVFIPVSFLGGLAGQMYKQFAVTISVSVVLSGVVALTLTPALCMLLLKDTTNAASTPKIFVAFNRVFEKCTNGYVGTVRLVNDHGFFGMLAFAGVIALVVLMFRILPTSMLPDEDQGYAMGTVIMDDGASLHRTQKVVSLLEKTAQDDPAVNDYTTITGFDLLSSASKSNYSTVFYSFKPWEERTTPELTDKAVVQRMGRLNAMQPSAVILTFLPPPIPGMSNTGGFDGYIQMRTGGTLTELEETANKIVAACSKRPELAFVQNLFTTGAPQLYANLDRERCKDMGISVADVFTAMQGTFGTYYINDFNKLGRTFQVRMQADADYRVRPENLDDIFVRNSSGEMVPLSAIMTLERRTAPELVNRYNIFPAAHFLGGPAPGYTTGQALQAVEEVCAEVAPAGFQIGWAGSSLQEKMASADTSTVFILSLIMVFLILAAQYESWSLPLAVLTAVPFGVAGALAATWARGLSNDVYFQVALVTLIGLAAKNAILIVEFAAEAWRSGLCLRAAALHAARLRFRPIVMTSLAFILGVVPLAVSTGAGANSRHAIGTAVCGGMLAATCIATLFIPFFFRGIVQLSLFLRRQKDPNEGKETLEEAFK